MISPQDFYDRKLHSLVPQSLEEEKKLCLEEWDAEGEVAPKLSVVSYLVQLDVGC